MILFIRFLEVHILTRPGFPNSPVAVMVSAGHAPIREPFLLMPGKCEHSHCLRSQKLVAIDADALDAAKEAKKAEKARKAKEAKKVEKGKKKKKNGAADSDAESDAESDDSLDYPDVAMKGAYVDLLCALPGVGASALAQISCSRSSEALRSVSSRALSERGGPEEQIAFDAGIERRCTRCGARDSTRAACVPKLAFARHQLVEYLLGLDDVEYILIEAYFDQVRHAAQSQGSNSCEGR